MFSDESKVHSANAHSTSALSGSAQECAEPAMPQLALPDLSLESSSALPKRIMSGYWHSWKAGAGFIKLADVNPNWDVINIAFAEPVKPGSTDGKMKFALNSGLPDYGEKEFKEDIKTLQAKGKKIVLSIGGWVGHFSLTSSGAANTFASDINGLISQYGFNGIDIDLEQKSIELQSGDKNFKKPTSPKIVNLIQGLKTILKGKPSDFILSFAPETLFLHGGYRAYGPDTGMDARCGDYLPVIYALGNAVTYVQAQLYNSGAILAPDGQWYNMGDEKSLVAMCKMLLNGFEVGKDKNMVWAGLRPDQVLIGLPASPRAANTGQVNNQDLQKAFATLNNAHPGLRGIMAWSINWDNAENANSFAIQNRAFLNTLP